VTTNILYIVVDADIARSSGNTEHPISIHARKVLEEIKSNGHVCVMCPTLQAEWNKHKSNYATRWYTSMVARRKIKRGNYISDVKNHIELNVTESKIKNIAIKDAHLIDIALAESGIIISNDNNARVAFCEIGNGYKKIQTIIWLHSVKDSKFTTSFFSKRCFVPEDLCLKKIPLI